MRKKEGGVYKAVDALLKEQGVLDTSSLEIATLGRGTQHLIILKGETVGEYNHRSEQMIIYSDAEL